MIMLPRGKTADHIAYIIGLHKPVTLKDFLPANHMPGRSDPDVKLNLTNAARAIAEMLQDGWHYRQWC